jgi:hypothetical protein
VIHACVVGRDGVEDAGEWIAIQLNEDLLHWLVTPYIRVAISPTSAAWVVSP